jgi:hypothetical protein
MDQYAGKKVPWPRLQAPGGIVRALDTQKDFDGFVDDDPIGDVNQDAILEGLRIPITERSSGCEGHLTQPRDQAIRGFFESLPE